LKELWKVYTYEEKKQISVQQQEKELQVIKKSKKITGRLQNGGGILTKFQERLNNVITFATVGIVYYIREKNGSDAVKKTREILERVSPMRHVFEKYCSAKGTSKCNQSEKKEDGILHKKIRGGKIS